MKIEVHKNTIEFEIESEEDLYVLYLLIDKGDLLYGWTTREFKTRKHEKGERKKIYIGLRVETLEYHAFRGSLRVRGVIIEAPEWFDGIIGSHHTMELIRGVKYRLVKSENFDIVTLQRVLDLFSRSHARALIISVGDEETTIANCRVFGIEVVTSIVNRHVTGKAAEVDRSKQFEKYAEDIVRQVKALVKPSDIDYIVIAGPSRVLDYVKETLVEGLKSLGKPIKVVQLSEGGLAGIYELQTYASDALADILRLHELKLVDEIFDRLARGRGDVAIGIDEVKKALEQGAVQHLLIIDELYKELGPEIKELVNTLVRTGAGLVIVPSFTNAADKLRGLGGIAALLRYELFREE